MSDTIDLAQFEGHTPGKWRWGNYNGWLLSDSQDVAWGSEDGEIIVMLLVDAKLIAAAPDLLAELRTLRAADESRKRRDAAVSDLINAASAVMRNNNISNRSKLAEAIAAIKGEVK